ncbi:MAG: MBL fold metallo-hydrolase [Solirubrobacterales bacterium]|jgi:glyoxylase-like metal-dependent hydrolase (beta-lactamase superfamily II)
MRQVAALVGMLVSGVAAAQQRPPQFEMDIKTIKLADNLYVLEGAGGNVAVFVWDDGVLLVDDKLAPASPKVKAAVAAITPRPIRFVVNSHWHRDHSGGNEALASDGSVVVAHENVRRRMSVDGFIAVFDRKVPASPPKALPVVTFTRDVTFHLGGEEISVVHVEPAHTDGDSFVRFRNANVLHMGDCYLNGSFPVIDFSNGGVFTGIIAGADAALGMLDPRTRIIPGHGPVATGRDLRQWRDMLATIHERVRRSVTAGKSLEEVKAERPTKEWDERFPSSFVTSDHVVEEAYRAVTSN